ncbi:MAG: FmdB family zinc ribbon protein [Deltaproteobacteria bacterium]
MPLRDFKCRRCSHVFETLIRRPEEERELSCPSCQGDQLDRLLSAPADLRESSSGAACQPRRGFG